MSSKTNLRALLLPLATGFALGGCSDRATNPTIPAAGAPTGAAGALATAGTGGAATAGGGGTSTGGTEGNPVTGGLDTGMAMGPAPTGIVSCDESVIGGSAPNTLTVDIDGAATVIPKEIFGVLLE